MRSYHSPFIMLATLLVCSATLAPALSHAGELSAFNRFFERLGLFQGLTITGQNSLTFQGNKLEGSTSAYENSRWDSGSFVRQSSLTLSGPVWKQFVFKADLSATGYSSAYSRWVVGWVADKTALYYGDLNVDLSGNQFVSFSKAVQGWQLDQKIGQGFARVFQTQEKGVTRTQVISGNNTSGPFFLTYSPVVSGSEMVKINEQLQRFGEDYRLDYDTGQLWFDPVGKTAKIIPDTSTITVSYQSQGYDTQSSTLSGMRAVMPVGGDRMRVGVTYLNQDSGGDNSRLDTVAYQEDSYQGSGSTGPFDVSYRPIIANGTTATYKGVHQVIQQALLVLVDNVEQAETVDYDAYRSIGRIIFRRSVPPTSLVVIRYYYDISNSLTVADKRLYGVDMRYRLSPAMNLTAEWGRSDTGITSSSGDAKRLNVDYNKGNVRFMGEYRDTAPTFSFLDSVGFYTQDKGMDVGLNWQAAPWASFYVRRSDLKSTSSWSSGSSTISTSRNLTTNMTTNMTTQSTTASSLDIHNTRTELEARLERKGWPSFSVQHQLLGSVGGTTSDSDYTGTNYRVAYSPTSGLYTLSATLNNTQQLYLAADDGDTTGSQTKQMQWAASYRPSSRMSFSYNIGRNTSDAIGSINHSSSSLDQFSVRWTPSDKLEFNYDLSRTASLGYVSGAGSTTTSSIGSSLLNLAGKTTNNGLIQTADTTTTDSRYEDSTGRWGVSWRPSQKLNFDFSITQRDYSSGGSVGYLADSNQFTRALTTSYQMSPALGLTATYSNDNLRYLDTTKGRVTNDLIQLGINYRRPKTPWGLSLTYNKQSGVSPTYVGFGTNQVMWMVENDLEDLQGQITYQLSEEADLVLRGELSDYNGGYSAFTKAQTDIVYQRRVGQDGKLEAGYRFLRNLTHPTDDPRLGSISLTPSNQSYIANTFLVTYSTQFNSTLGGGRNSRAATIAGGGTSSLSSFGGYRAGAINWGSEGTTYQNLSVYGQTNQNSTNIPGFTAPSLTGTDSTSGSWNSGQMTGSSTSLGQTAGVDQLRLSTAGGPLGGPGRGGKPGPNEESWNQWLLMEDVPLIWW